MSEVIEKWLKSAGFAGRPKFVEATGNETLYRVYGGPSSKLYGSCYSLTKPTSVNSAEMSANIAKWGNRMFFLASFKIFKGSPMFVGKVDQSFAGKNEVGGDDILLGGDPNAEQVWIDPKKAEWYLTLLSIETLNQSIHCVIPDQKYDA